MIKIKDYMKMRGLKHGDPDYSAIYSLKTAHKKRGDTSLFKLIDGEWYMQDNYKVNQVVCDEYSEAIELLEELSTIYNTYGKVARALSPHMGTTSEGIYQWLNKSFGSRSKTTIKFINAAKKVLGK